jgi:hypothetical protein
VTRQTGETPNGCILHYVRLTPLTTQIYFVDQGVGLEGAVALTGTDLDALITELEPADAEDGVPAFSAMHAIVLE